LRKDYIVKMRKMFDITPGKNRAQRWKIVNSVFHRPLNNPFYYNTQISNWGADQKMSDEISFLAAMRQRVRWSTVQDNADNLRRQKDFGTLCWERFRRYMNWEKSVPWDDNVFTQSIIAFQERRGEKSVALKKGILSNTDPGQQRIMMLAKNQVKLKTRLRTDHASPLQPVMVHSVEYVFRWGAQGIYMLEMLLRNSPDYWFMYAKKTPDEFNAWVETHFEKGERLHMNDLTGQDQSTQGWAVQFFKLMLEWFNFPKQDVDDFVYDKMAKQVGHKVLALMTNSGEIWTYLINTCSSTARECAIFDLPPGLPMANGGDDTMRRCFGTKGDAYRQVAHLDPCEDKRYESTTGDFCSFIVKNGKLLKDPIILLKRFLVKIARGQAEEAVLGYAHLWAMNYRLGDQLFDLLDEEELQAHQLMTSMMFNLKKEGISTRPNWDNLNIRGDLTSDIGLDLITSNPSKLEKFLNVSTFSQVATSTAQVAQDYVQAAMFVE